VVASVAYPEAGEGKYTTADLRGLSEADLVDLRVERIVTLVLADGATVNVRETVFEPRHLDLVSDFESSREMLESIAESPDVRQLLVAQ
jgi:hypothetical protein